MNPVDILGELLGHKSSRAGRGGDVLNDIFGRKTQRSAPRRPSESSPLSKSEIQRQADELEDMLNVAKDSSSRRRSESTHSSRTPSPAPASRDRDIPGSADSERATILIRAMVNAAKADGKLDEKEQKAIIDQMKNPSREEIEFLRQEFARPFDMSDFVRSVPLGMEQQVYTMSLIAVDLDTGKEAKYFAELADALRLPLEVREQIHQRLGAPSVY